MGKQAINNAEQYPRELAGSPVRGGDEWDACRSLLIPTRATSGRWVSLADRCWFRRRRKGWRA